LRQELEPQAREQVKIALLLEAIARQEGITVDDEEVERQIETLAAEAGSAADRVRVLYQDPAARQDLRSRVVQSRTIDAVLRRARVTTVKQPASVAAADQNR
jgi:trigger factor